MKRIEEHVFIRRESGTHRITFAALAPTRSLFVSQVFHTSSLSIVSTDLVGLIDYDTTEIFSILDGIVPMVTVTGPAEDFSVPEFHPVTVTWEASDNIGLDSAWIWYSVNGGNDYISAGATLASLLE